CHLNDLFAPQLESTIRFLEPVLSTTPPKSGITANFGGDQIVYFKQFKVSTGGISPHIYIYFSSIPLSIKELYIPQTCHDLVFLRTQLAILHPRGGEIIDKET